MLEGLNLQTTKHSFRMRGLQIKSHSCRVKALAYRDVSKAKISLFSVMQIEIESFRKNLVSQSSLAVKTESLGSVSRG